MARARLSTEVVVSEALNLIDERGHDRLSLAAIAKRFGVAQPSLYKHISGLDALHRLLAARVTWELGGRLRRAATGKAGSDAWQAFAHAYRDYARSHPGRYAYALRAPDAEDGDHQAAAAEILAVLDGVFAGYGISGDDAVDAARYVRSTLHGFAGLEQAAGFRLPQSLEQSFARAVAAVDRTLTDW